MKDAGETDDFGLVAVALIIIETAAAKCWNREVAKHE